MLPALLKLKLATSAALGVAAATGGAPAPAQAMAALVAERASLPVEVSLYDENLRVHATVAIRRDGSMDEATAAEVKHLFRCRQYYK